MFDFHIKNKEFAEYAEIQHSSKASWKTLCLYLSTVDWALKFISVF